VVRVSRKKAGSFSQNACEQLVRPVAQAKVMGLCGNKNAQARVPMPLKAHCLPHLANAPNVANSDGINFERSHLELT
jgi:hypothetical protein